MTFHPMRHWHVAALLLSTLVAPLHSQDTDVAALVAAMLGETPLIEDARWLTDGIGGRATGSPENLAAVEWAVRTFEAAGLRAWKEPFQMPELWLERSASALIRGDAEFSARVAAMPFSTATGPGGLTAPVVDAGRGTAADLTRLGARVRGAFLLVETDVLEDVADLFQEYADATDFETRALPLGVAGIIYMGSRPNDILYRHNASLGPANIHPMAVMERDAATRILRLLRTGHALTVTLTIDIDGGQPYESYNVIAEIPGTADPEEIVLIGAHLDSWDLGTGALDNGANAAMIIDLARQMRRLGMRPRRTIRFALWNAEEQGLMGSWRYTEAHQDEMDRFVMASSFDIGTGRITGFFTGGRSEVAAATDRALAPVAGLGPFQQIDVPIVGTDNFDFMMQGVANLVANQADANYGPNYHARSDTFDKIDQHQLRLNAAIAGAVVWGFANMEVTWNRQTRAELDALVATTDLEAQMTMLGIWNDWVSGRRGRQDR
jgi:hypothetical protein